MERIDQYRDKVTSLTNPTTSKEWKQYNQYALLRDLFEQLDKIESQISQSKELAQDKDDEDIQELAAEELEDLKSTESRILKRISEEISNIETVSDDRDEKNVILEIRAGAGGEEAALFAADLFRMYSQYAQKKGYTVEILSTSISDTGGFKEIVAGISGESVFSRLKYESGVHRVQRIPTTESSGRIHTSTASVAVMPEADEVDVDISPEELTIETFRASGAGGQHVNKTESAIRITHKPSGIVVNCQESRSQIKNRETAMNLLRSKLYEKQVEEQQNERDSIRRDQIGSAMRSEKIRTYNYPQSRITDHRIKKSWHNLDGVLDGDLDEIIDALSSPIPSE